MPRFPPWLTTLLKIAVAAGLIYWLVQRGSLDLAAVGAALTRWPVLLLMAAVYYLQLGLIAWRWSFLLRAQQVRFYPREVFSLTMIGALFSLVTPSAVGGDLMKSYYVYQGSGDRKTEALATIALDRVVGLLALVFVAAAAGAPSLVGSHPKLRPLSLFAVALAVAGGAALALALRAAPGTLDLAGKSRLVALVWRVLSAFAAYRRERSLLAAAFGAAMLSHLLACGNFYLAAQTVREELPLRFLFLFPLGLMSTALPVSPAGIGVGQAALAELFRIASEGRLLFGANAFTVFQVVPVLVNLTGVLFYLSYRRREQKVSGN